MSKKTKRQAIKTVWGVIVVLSVILGLIASILQLSGTVDFWTLLFLPIYTLLITETPIYHAILFVAVVIIVLYFAVKLRRRGKSCILDLEDGRKIAILCQTPRTTDFLRQQYDFWQRQSGVVVLGGYNFDDYMKRLEREGFLEYINGQWRVTQKALAYIVKYHGR